MGLPFICLISAHYGRKTQSTSEGTIWRATILQWVLTGSPHGVLLLQWIHQWKWGNGICFAIYRLCTHCCMPELMKSLHYSGHETQTNWFHLPGWVLLNAQGTPAQLRQTVFFLAWDLVLGISFLNTIIFFQQCTGSGCWMMQERFIAAEHDSKTSNFCQYRVIDSICRAFLLPLGGESYWVVGINAYRLPGELHLGNLRQLMWWLGLRSQSYMHAGSLDWLLWKWIGIYIMSEGQRPYLPEPVQPVCHWPVAGCWPAGIYLLSLGDMPCYRSAAGCSD
jgi:hypothetical protein